MTDITPHPTAIGWSDAESRSVIAVVTALPEEREGIRTALRTSVPPGKGTRTEPFPQTSPDTPEGGTGWYGIDDRGAGIEIIFPEEHRISGIGLPLALVATGAGKVAAAAGLAELFHRVRPHLLLCGGIAGSLDPELNPGSKMIAERCWYYDRDATAARLSFGAVTRNGPDRFEFPEAAALAVRLGWRSGTIATGDSVVTARLRDALPRKWRNRLAESSLVDMESAVWAELADEHGIKTVICRTVYDVIGYQPSVPPGTDRTIGFREACVRSGEALVAVLREFPGSL
ncbi:MAG: hypothetical protein ACLFR8_09060 [Alkalispirochaeta sp.]